MLQLIRTGKTCRLLMTRRTGALLRTESGRDQADILCSRLPGTLVSMRLKGQDYYYINNSQGDVIGLVDSGGIQVVSYQYDSWGRQISMEDNTPSSVNAGTRNPFRYREYFWDDETGLYYLNTRYYDPETGRFVNADSPALILEGQTGLSDKNLYAYCDNNPIMRTDTGGEFWHLVIGAVVGIASQYVADVEMNILAGKSLKDSLLNPTSSWADYGAAALSGAISATGIGLAGSVAANAAIGGATYLANCKINKEDGDVKNLIGATVIGGFGGFAGGKGLDTKKMPGVVKDAKRQLKRFTSKKKIKMYKGKINKIYKSVSKAARKMVRVSIGTNIANNIRKFYTRSKS